MRFKGLDLNLLVALDALLSERSVSAAGERIFLSQPAMSGALNRLRDFFQDELLVPSGRRMVLTPRAEGLVAPVRACLVQIETTIASPPVFEPIACQRRFVIEASDYISEVLIAPVARVLSVLAPKISIEITPRQQSAESALDSGEIDLVITPDVYAAASHAAELLFEETHVVVGWSGNPRLRPGFTTEDFYDLGHVAVHMQKGRRSAYAELHVPYESRVRRVEVSVPSFNEVPRYLIGTQRVALLQARLARLLIARNPLTMVPITFPLPPLREVMQHHGIRDKDRALAWLRSVIREVAASGEIEDTAMPILTPARLEALAAQN